jgi:integrase
MARLSNKLTARSVATAKPGRHGDGNGLWLDVTKTGRKSWVFRYTFSGRVRETGLGSAAKVPLAKAREKALACHVHLAAGIDPVEHRRSEKQEPAVKTFGAAATEYHAAKSPGWRSEKYAGQWLASINQFAAVLSAMPVDQVGTEAVLAILKPVWLSKSVTAEKLRGRIETVLDFARVKNWRSGENPARWRGHLDHLLPRPKHARKHHSAMDYSAVRDFVGKLRVWDSITALALEFLILTAARSGEVLGARWAEIDLDAKVWTVPASRMKADREHRVPLSGRALAILERLEPVRTNSFVFPGRQGPLGSDALRARLRKTGVPDATPHGFRSAFRDWCGNETNFPREIAEQALAHAAGNAVELAYRRGDALEKRRSLMERWARYCEFGAESNIVPTRANPVR